MSEKKSILTPGELKASAEKVWLAGLGALSAAQEEGGRLFKNLIDKGMDFEKKVVDTARDNVDEVKEQIEGAGKKLENTWDSVENNIKGIVESTMQRVGMPTRDDIQSLSDRVENLTERISAMPEVESLKDFASDVGDTFEETSEKIFETPVGRKLEKVGESVVGVFEKAASFVGEAIGQITDEDSPEPVTMNHLGGGWYEIRRGDEVIEKIRGKTNAEKALDALQ